MKIAVISVTEKGRLLSARLARGLGQVYTVERYCFHKHCDPEAEAFISVSGITKELFSFVDALIFICACGIAIRAIAPHISSKLTDPAVIVMDDSGRWAVPVLSGHIGGANRLALKAASVTGAEAVISTATDAAGRFSPDCFAMDNGLLIKSMESAKKIAAASANGEPVYFFSEYDHECVPEGLIPADRSQNPEELAAGGAAVIYVGTGCQKDVSPDLCVLVPRNIVLGIGCRKNADAADIERTVSEALTENGIMPERVTAAGTIDIKKDEPGLKEFCMKWKIGLYTFSASELNSTDLVPGGDSYFHGSDFVKSVTGTDNVCERSAVRLSGGGRLVISKKKGSGVTVAAAEKDIFLRFGTQNGQIICCRLREREPGRAYLRG